jgi:hypothetical protein
MTNSTGFESWANNFSFSGCSVPTALVPTLSYQIIHGLIFSSFLNIGIPNSVNSLYFSHITVLLIIFNGAFKVPLVWLGIGD